MLTQRTGSLLRLTITDDPVFRGFTFAQLVLAAIAPDDREIVLDLHLITTLHSPGLANLVQIYVSCTKRGVILRLAGVNEFNRRLLTSTHLDQLFTFQD